MSKEFETDNGVIADFMKNQTEIFQQISDLIEPEEIVEEIESITKGRIVDDAKDDEKKPQLLFKLMRKKTVKKLLPI